LRCFQRRCRGAGARACGRHRTRLLTLVARLAREEKEVGRYGCGGSVQDEARGEANVQWLGNVQRGVWISSVAGPFMTALCCCALRLGGDI
jgi:hypothetical protein